MLTPKEKSELQKHVHGIDVRHMSTAFDALGEPNRCLIFRALLKRKDVRVSEIAAVIGVSAPLASQHLKVLLQAGLLERIKAGKEVYYHVNKNDSLVLALEKAVEG